MDNIITLRNELGEDVQFEFLDLIAYEGKEYVVLLPAGDAEEVGEVVILQLESSDEDTEEESYIGISEEEILIPVYRLFRERHKKEYNFMEE